MKSIKRYIQNIKFIVENLKSSDKFYTISTYDDPALFHKDIEDWEETFKGLDKEIISIIKEATSYKAFNYVPRAIRNKIIIDILSTQQYFCFLIDSSTIVFINSDTDEEKPLKLFEKLNPYFKKEFNTNFSIEKTSARVLNILQQRIESAENYYLNENGAWVQDFLNNLGDEISKISLRTFLKQRVSAHILWDTKAMYPITPPVETEKWRQERQTNSPKLPIINHCRETLRAFFYRCTFIHEQYGIEGIVQAKTGDIVIDAGAFIADTALYFAEKVGEAGKVYAFEVFPESIEHGNDNLRQNNVSNVEMVHYALSDKSELLSFSTTPIESNIELDADGDLKVNAISLDCFLEERKIPKIDFIKSDIEGMEMELLKGAEKTIRRDKPICGIALYHNKEDFIAIPKLLKEYCPEYTFYFRCEAEPVLLAKVLE